jgi:hypothetical protein
MPDDANHNPNGYAGAQKDHACPNQDSYWYFPQGEKLISSDSGNFPILS